MASFAETRQRPPVANVHGWNVCTDLDPSLAGLYRGVVDFGRALDAPILSFGRPSSSADFAADVPLSRVASGFNPPGYAGLFTGQAAAQSASRIIGNADPLIVHSLFRGHVAWATDHARHSKARLWSVPHGCLDPWGLKQRWVLKRAWLAVYGERFLRDASVMVFATQRERGKALPWIRSCQAAVIPWPVALPNLEDRAAARARFRESRGFSDSAVILLFVARLHSMKRPAETVAAFCASDCDDAHLVMVGMDDDVRAVQLASMVPTTHKGRVHFLGSLYSHDLHEALLAADGFISLSYRENFGYSFAEALGYDLPTIVSPGHDLAWDLPRDHSGRWPYGWLLPDDSRLSASRAIAELVRCCQSNARNPYSREPYWSSARPWIADHLNPERFRERLRQL